MMQPVPGLEGDADIIIVGAGSAGCVLAEALSRDGRLRVLVVEAGGSDQRFWVKVPLGYGKTFYDPRINWAYKTEPDPGLAGRADYWPRGRVLGGSSSINAMVWMRCDASDFNDWASEGNEGWDWQRVLPVFRSLEHNASGADEWRAQGGPMHISDLSDRVHPLTWRWIEAAQQAGFPRNHDFNGPSQEGIGLYQTNTRNGFRHSAATAFLRPALNRPNLRLLLNQLVTRVMIEQGRATGIELRAWPDGPLRVLRARAAVVLAAGAIGSPTLLERSGIGSGEVLQALGIPVLQHLPAVGRHMQDHLGINYTWRGRERTLNDQLRPFLGRMLAGADYVLRRRGPLSLSLNQGGGFVRSNPQEVRANIQLYFQAFSTLTAKIGERPLLRPDPFSGFSIGLSNCRPESRGEIHVRNPDPLAPPVIRPNALATERDCREVVEGLRILRRIAAQPALAPLIEEELAPGPACQSDQQMLEDFRQRAGTVYHPCGTVRMGPTPERAAVTPRLEVWGLSGLRVIDASVFPSVPSGNIQAPTMMVAAKGAEMLLQDLAS